MTPGMWIWTILLAIVAVLGLAWLFLAALGAETTEGRIGGMIGGTLVVIVFGAAAFVPHWWQHNTEGGKRSLRNYHQTTNVDKSPTRVVRVYSATGQLVATYSGKFDVGHNGGFVDLDIHQPDGTIKRVLIDNSAGAMTVEDVTR